MLVGLLPFSVLSVSAESGGEETTGASRGAARASSSSYPALTNLVEGTEINYGYVYFFYKNGKVDRSSVSLNPEKCRNNKNLLEYYSSTTNLQRVVSYDNGILSYWTRTENDFLDLSELEGRSLTLVMFDHLELSALYAPGVDLKLMVTDGAYVRHHHQELPTLLAINAAELCLAAAALAVFVRNVLRRGFEETGAVAEGVLSGCLIIVYYVVFHLQIACFPDRYKTWYMYLPSVFCTAYLFVNVKDRRLLAAFFVPLMLWSAWQNGRIRSREEGTDRRELAEFMASVADRPAVFFVSGKDSDDLWKLECFDSALKYAVGGNDIRFKTDMEIPSAKRQILTGENYYGIRREAPAEGDYAVIRRNEEKRPENCGETVWQNRVYEVCRIKNKEREDKK